MKTKIKYILTSTIILTLFSIIISCATKPVTIPPNLSPSEFFQRAQDASEIGNYKLAMQYYLEFQKRYPDNLNKNLWAEYEIAFLYHKMGKDKKAVELLDKLIEKYNSKGTNKWPQAPKILAEKVKENILKKKK